MSTKGRSILIQATLDLLILRTLLFGTLHGHGIAQHIERTSDDVRQVEHGSLYPALRRLEVKRCITSKRHTTERGREMRFYKLMAKGERNCRPRNRIGIS
jgi:PadR family transcriptional regulator PadR